MNARDKSKGTGPAKYGIGQPVSRKEDPILVQGQGRYIGDVKLPGQAYTAMVRSPVAHGTITAIDAPAAIAETQAIAQDAAEAVFVDIDELPSVTQPGEAAKPDAPQGAKPIDMLATPQKVWHVIATAKAA